MKPFLILQLRPIDLAADNEFSSFLHYGGLKEHEVHRVRMEKESILKINLNEYSGIILGGGPSNVSDDEDKKYSYQRKFEVELNKLLDKVFETNFPMLGTCYGIGVLGKHQGGKVSKENYSEDVGVINIELTEAGKNDKLLKGLPANFMAYGGHKEACQTLPSNAILLARSNICPIQMVRFGQNIYATQFHTELDEEGITIRINIYKNHGYFSPEDAENLIMKAKSNLVTSPGLILNQFIKKYKRE